MASTTETSRSMNFSKNNLKRNPRTLSKRARSQQNKRAVAHRRRVTYTKGTRRFAGAVPESPISLSRIDAIESYKRKKRQRTDHSTESNQIPTTSGLPSSNVTVPQLEPMLPLFEDAAPIERKWRAVAIAMMREEQRESKRLHRREYEEIAADGGCKSGRSLERWIQKVRSGTPLTAIKPTGRKPLVLERVHSFMLERAAEFNYHFTTEVMGEQAKMNLRVGSKSTVQRVLKKKGWKKSKQVIRPYLSEENKEARLQFCRIWLRITANDNDMWRIHLDEKWFFAFPKGKILYCAEGVEPPIQVVSHKNHIPKVMFLAAIGQPTPAFHGNVGIWPVMKEHTPKRASARHPRVNGQLVPFMKCSTMDGDLFEHMIETLYFPAIVNLALPLLESLQNQQFVLKVYSQIDNAGGHAVDRTVASLNRKGASFNPRVRIHFHCQPPNSPDLNALDLGAWNSLQKAVPQIVYMPTLGKEEMQERIITAVRESFVEWNAEEKCRDLFETLTAFMYETILADGDNRFRQPHTKNLQDKILTIQDSLLAFPVLLPIEDPPSLAPVTLQLPLSSVTHALSPNNVIQIPSSLLDSIATSSNSSSSSS